MKMSKAFIKQLQEASAPVDMTRTYKCQNCHRPDLTYKQIGILSHGEAYCIWCTQ